MENSKSQSTKSTKELGLARVVKTLITPVVFIPRMIIRRYNYWYALHYPKRIAEANYSRITGGKKLNWDNPQDLNEKINWLKFNIDISEWTQLSDKYRVREYIKERKREDLLVKLYGVWENPNDIDFSSLPKQFVLKTNHGCGTVMVVTDKDKLNRSDTCKELNKWAKLKFGVLTAEPQYVNIKPLIIAEEYLNNDNPSSSSLVDYKVWCLDGKAFCIMVCADRVIGTGMQTSFYDLNWNFIPDLLSGSHKDNKVLIEKPNCLSELIKAAEDLAYGHPEVRVDFYIVNNRIYFGEMTFTSLGGYMDYISQKYLLEMGAQVTLPS